MTDTNDADLTALVTLLDELAKDEWLLRCDTRPEYVTGPFVRVFVVYLQDRDLVSRNAPQTYEGPDPKTAISHAVQAIETKDWANAFESGARDCRSLLSALDDPDCLERIAVQLDDPDPGNELPITVDQHVANIRATVNALHELFAAGLATLPPGRS